MKNHQQQSNQKTETEELSPYTDGEDFDAEYFDDPKSRKPKGKKILTMRKQFDR